MILTEADEEVITQYLLDESVRIAAAIDEDFSGLYGFFNGKYLTSTGYEPDGT